MTDSDSNLHSVRGFATHVVQTLRDAGHEALWAGGCVRDDLLGSIPKDYDVATSATPEQVIELFGKRRTVPVGVSFGVVMVLGPSRACGQVEVATFRSDGEYLDGRRPVDVRFCSPEEDAQRRDFTINGMFYDPVDRQVLDYVGGQSDLTAQIVRAIGNPRDRFSEDKLRMLRAVRFAATYGFTLEEQTAWAIRDLREQLTQVSIERITQELRRMLAHPTRAVSLRKLDEVGLLEILFPQVFAGATSETSHIEQVQCLQRGLSVMEEPFFEPSLALILARLLEVDVQQNLEGAASTVSRSSGKHTEAVQKECRRLKLSNQETNAVCWILQSAFSCVNAASRPLHVIKPLLADDRRHLLLDYLTARDSASGIEPEDAGFLRSYLHLAPAGVLNPPPLIDGSDLKASGVQPGPAFKELLTQIRNEQLDERLNSRDAALVRLRELASDR